MDLFGFPLPNNYLFLKLWINNLTTAKLHRKIFSVNKWYRYRFVYYYLSYGLWFQITSIEYWRQRSIGTKKTYKINNIIM